MIGKAVVVVASNRASTGVYEDITGPLIVQALRDWGFDVDRPVVRRAVRFAGGGHQPAHRLHDDVVGGQAAIRPVLSEPGDRAIDQALVERA